MGKKGYQNLMKNYNKNSNKVYFIEVDVEYPRNSCNFHKDLLFLSEREKIEKCERLVCNIKDTNDMLFTQGL